MSTCTIAFNNNPYGVYYAGQTVSGTAELVTTRPKTIRSIYISVSGYAEVRWTETVVKQTADGKRENAIETFSGSETYYNSDTYVYGQSDSSQMELPAGKYVFPFQATIVPNAPTSFNGAWGQIQHEVSLVIDRVMRYNNVFKQPYSVISPYDLNLNADHARPLHQIEEKTICWGLCCGGKGPMVMKVNSPFSAYAPGQKIRFNIVLDNQMDLDCSDVKVRLMKKVTYTSQSPSTKTQVTEIKVADNHCGDVVKQNKAEFNEFLQIPATTPTSLSTCSIIKIEYTLKFIAKISRIFGDLIIEFPLTIGTVPLYVSVNEQGPITSQPGAGPPGPVFKPLAPPMYEEDARSEQFENNKFVPRYPVFLIGEVTNPSMGGAPDSNIYPVPNAPSTDIYPSPKPDNSIYPSPIPSAEPYPPNTPNSIKAATPDPIPPAGAINVPSTPTPSALIPTGPSTVGANQVTPNRVDGTNNDPIEVLGFSIPPDYQPTPGWK